MRKVLLALALGVVPLLAQAQGVNIKDLPLATTPLSGSDLFAVTQGGAFHKLPGTSLGLAAGLGTMSTQNANAVAITGGTINGITSTGLAQHVPTNAALIAVSTATYPNGVWRDDYSAGLGAPPLWFLPESGSCAANSLVNDGGHCVDASGGNSWVSKVNGIAEDVRQYGAACTNSSDEHVAIQAAINSVASRQGILELFSGATCLTGTSTLTIGNGSSSVVSTLHGFILRGVSNPTGNGDGTKPISGARIIYGGTGNAIEIDGPLTGWGLQNLYISCTANNVNASGIDVRSAQWGDNKNLTISQCGRGIFSTVVGAVPAGISNVDSLHNSWSNVAIDVPNLDGAIGIQETGVHNVGNTDFGYWANVYCSMANGTVAFVRQCLVLQLTDSGRYTQVHVFTSGSATDRAVVYDYSTDNVYPSGTVVDQMDSSASLPIVINGTPSASAPINYMQNFNLSNSTPLPTDGTLANLYLVGTTNTWTPTVLSDGSAITPTYISRVGSYISNGPLITATFYIDFTFTGGTGNLYVGGLPLRSADISITTLCQVTAATGWTAAAGYVTLYGGLLPHDFNISLLETASAHNAQLAALSEFTGTIQLSGQCSYARAQQ